MREAVLQWGLDVLHGLDEAALIVPDGPVPGMEPLTVRLWFTAADVQARQVIVNHGADELTPVGWSLALEAGRLIGVVGTDEKAVAFCRP